MRAKTETVFDIDVLYNF